MNVWQESEKSPFIFSVGDLQWRHFGCSQTATKGVLLQQPARGCPRSTPTQEPTILMVDGHFNRTEHSWSPPPAIWPEKQTGSTMEGKIYSKQALSCADLSLEWAHLNPGLIASCAHLEGRAVSGLRPPWSYSKQDISASQDPQPGKGEET